MVAVIAAGEALGRVSVPPLRLGDRFDTGRAAGDHRHPRVARVALREQCLEAVVEFRGNAHGGVDVPVVWQSLHDRHQTRAADAVLLVGEARAEQPSVEVAVEAIKVASQEVFSGVELLVVWFQGNRVRVVLAG